MNPFLLFLIKFETSRWIHKAAALSMISSQRTPAHLSIPPIRIPYFAPCRDVPPHLHASERQVVPTEYVEHDFPSPSPNTAETCVMCDIALTNGVETEDGDTCTSCITIYRNYMRYGTPMPSCSICESDCYYIHRECNQPFCMTCKCDMRLCPHCKTPI